MEPKAEHIENIKNEKDKIERNLILGKNKSNINQSIINDYKSEFNENFFFNNQDIYTNINYLSFNKKISNINNNNNINHINFIKDMNNSLRTSDSKIMDKKNINNLINFNNEYNNSINIINQNNHINYINANQNINLIYNDNNNFIKEEDFASINGIKSKNNYKSVQTSIKQIIHNIQIILSLLSNYKGSIYLQKILPFFDNKEISSLFSIIYPHICNLICLEYGNYFIQKLIKKLNVQQRLEIYHAIDANFLNIANNKNGTHVIQVLIDANETPLEDNYLNHLLNKNMLYLLKNENGYHIIMKMIIEKPENQRNNINIFLVSNVEKIIINSYGAYCVIKFITNNSDLNLRLLLIKNIKNNFENLIINKISCSVLMSAIKHFGINDFQFIVQEIRYNLPFFYLDPISASFVGKVLSYMNRTENYKLSSIIWDIYRDDNLLNAIYSSTYGSKILKKLKEYSNFTQKKYLNVKINFIKSNINDSLYNKK